jgi:hypothetical protein
LAVEHINNPPLVQKAFEAYRSSGYDFPTSVADLIDNAIGAGRSTRIHMNFRVIEGSGDLTFYLADNGSGMNRDALISAMQLGSGESSEKHELSKFGHGMKTASWAHAKRLVVISRPEGDIDNPVGAAWDGDHITQKNEWEMEIIDRPPNVYLEYLDELDGKVSGTIVVWEKIDRLLANYKDLLGKPRRARLDLLLSQVREHLGLVFHRFLDHSYGEAPNIEIFVNDVAVEPWDPFAEKYGNFLQPLMQKELKLGDRRPITVSPFLLPREDKWEFEEPYGAAVKKANELQGFYLYRANRLLQLPSWLGQGKQEPHSNLARVKVDINSDWDEDLHVDVKKATVTFPGAQKDELAKVKNFISGLAKKQRADTPGLRRGNSDKHRLGSAAIDIHKSEIRRNSVSEVNEKQSTATVTNKQGSVPNIRLVKPEPGLPVNVIVSENGLRDGHLWDSVVVYVDGSQTETALQLSATHEFYRRAYLPASMNPAGKKATDMIFWALAQAELNLVSASNSELFEDFKIELSRALRLLASELPEPEDDLDEIGN